MKVLAHFAMFAMVGGVCVDGDACASAQAASMLQQERDKLAVASLREKVETGGMSIACVPATLLPAGARCLTNDQCAEGSCCPLRKYCNGGAGKNGWNADPILNPQYYCGSTTGSWSGCGNGVPTGNDAKGVCDSVTLGGSTFGECGSRVFNDGIYAALNGGLTLGTFDLSLSKCGCTGNAYFLEHYNAGTWAGKFDSSGAFENACAAGACTNDPPGWRNQGGFTCVDYQNNNYCTSSGGYGSGWGPIDTWGTFDDYKGLDGKSPDQACCFCGGGITPADNSRGDRADGADNRRGYYDYHFCDDDYYYCDDADGADNSR